MKCTELLTPEEGIYEFVYPMVVGPRLFEPACGCAPRKSVDRYFPFASGESTAFPPTQCVSAGLPI